MTDKPFSVADRIVKNLHYLSDIIGQRYADRITPQERQWLVDAAVAVGDGGELSKEAVAYVSQIRARCVGRKLAAA